MKTATVQKRCTVALTSTLCSVFIRKNHKRIMLVAGSSTGTAKLRDAVWQTVSFHLTLTGMFSIKMNQIIFSHSKIQTRTHNSGNLDITLCTVFDYCCSCNDIQLFKDSIKKMYIDFFNSIFQNDLQCLSF